MCAAVLTYVRCILLQQNRVIQQLETNTTTMWNVRQMAAPVLPQFNHTGSSSERRTYVGREGRDIWLTGSASALSRYTTKIAEEGGLEFMLVTLSFLFRTWANFTNIVWIVKTSRRKIQAGTDDSFLHFCLNRKAPTCSSCSVLDCKANHSSLKWTRPDGVSFKVNH